MRYVFDDLGYRRYEWKCDSLNASSRRAAERLGFVYEGTFRNAVVYRGRSRDTAWYAITDGDWPQVKQAFETWLEPANFDIDGTTSPAPGVPQPRCGFRPAEFRVASASERWMAQVEIRTASLADLARRSDSLTCRQLRRQRSMAGTVARRGRRLGRPPRSRRTPAVRPAGLPRVHRWPRCGRPTGTP
jgi:hypothetical protein